MMFRKGMSNALIATMVFLALGVLFLFVFTTGFGAQVRNTFSTLNGCNVKDGMCLQTSCGDARMLPNGNVACEKEEGEGYVCCTSPEIKQQIAELKEGIIPQGSKLVELEVEGKSRDYRTGEQVPVFAGKKYVFGSVKGDFTSKGGDKKIGDMYCVMRLVDQSNDKVVKVMTETAEPSDSGTIRDDGGILRFGDRSTFDYSENLVPAVKEKKCKDVKLGFIVPLDGVRRNLEVEVNIYQEESDVNNGNNIQAMTEFPLNVKLPVRVSGISGDWSENEEITLTCAVGGCISATYKPIKSGNNPIRVCMEESIDGELGKHTFDYEARSKIIVDEEKIEEMIDKYGLPSEGFIAPLCFNVELDTGESVRVVGNDYLKVDRNPPVVNLNGLTIDCEDGESGCARYHYAIMASTEQRDVEDVSDAVIEAAVNELFEDSICPTPPEKYPNKWRTTSQPEIPISDALGATVCVYAEDEAGNTGEIAQDTYVDWDFSLSKLSKDNLKDLSQDALRDLKNDAKDEAKEGLKDFLDGLI